MAFRHSTADSAEDREPNGLGIMLTFLAGLLLIATGLSLLVYGLMSLGGAINGRSTEVLFHVGSTPWSITHIVGGIILFIAGCNVFVGRYWAQIVGIVCAALAIIGGLISIDAYPVWGIGLVVLNIAIIWALAVHGNDLSFD